MQPVIGPAAPVGTCAADPSAAVAALTQQPEQPELERPQRDRPDQDQCDRKQHAEPPSLAAVDSNVRAFVGEQQLAGERIGAPRESPVSQLIALDSCSLVIR
jgi:hypothetical protein